jgi:hypothetical protein
MATVQQIIDRLERERAAKSPDRSEPATEPNLPVHDDYYDYDMRYEMAVEQNSPVKRRSLVPSRKVGASSIGGALTVILVAIASHYGWQIDADVSGAATLILMTAIGYLTNDKLQ